MLLLVDNGSVFTKDIANTLSNSGIKFDQKPSDQINLDDFSDYDSFILSGRRNNDSQMNAKNSKIILHAVNEKKKLLGICYGAEILALALGGTIRKSSVIRGEQEIISSKNLLCDGKKIVFESHSYEISKLGSSLDVIAESENCKNEIDAKKIEKLNDQMSAKYYEKSQREKHSKMNKFCLESDPSDLYLIDY